MYGRLLAIQILSAAVSVANRFIDSMITGALLGVTAIGASGIISQASLVPAVLSGVVSMGLYSVCSEAIGTKNYRLAGQQLSTALALVTIVFIPVVALLEIFCDPLCAVLCDNTDATFIATTSAYARGLAPSLYFAAVIPYLMYACQMNSKARLCSISVGVMFVINVCGDLIVALCTDLGMLGIGLTTTLSSIGPLLILVGPSINRKLSLHLRWGMSLSAFGKISKRMVSFGLPSAVTTLANAFAGIWVNCLLLSVADYTAVAAYTCAYSVTNLLYLPASSMWYCTSIITSVMYGKNMYEAIRQLPAVFTKVAIGLTVLPFILALVLSTPLCSLFIHSQPEVLALAETCTYILALNLFPNALITCFQSLLRSTEHRIAAVVLPAIYLIGVLPALSWPLAHLFGAPGVCAGRVGAYCLGLIGFMVVCAVRKKASPFKPCTYVFLPPLAQGYSENNLGLVRYEQIDETATGIEAFFASNDSPQAEPLAKASAVLLDALLKKNSRRCPCWVHAALKDGEPWVQVTCVRKTLNAGLVNSLAFDNINVSYLDFSMLGAAELYTGEPPYGSPKRKG